MTITLEQGINAVLDYFMDGLKTENELIDYAADYIDTQTVPALVGMSDKDWKTISSYNSAKWEKLFKQRFGFTDMEFVKQIQQAYQASLTERERKLFNEMQRVLTESIWFVLRDGKPTIRATYYKMSNKSTVFELIDGWTQGVKLSEKWLPEFGFTLEEAEDFVKRLGAIQKKRPRTLRNRNYNATYYD